jgi:AAA domain
MTSDLRTVLEGVGFTIQRERPWKGHRVYMLEQCPFQNHSGTGKACVVERTDGRVAFRCQAAKCRGRTWSDLCALHPTLAASGFFDHLNQPWPPSVIRMDQISPMPVHWLWSSRIARRKVSLFVGDPGAGKGKVVCEVTGCLTSGRALPGGAAIPPIHVLLCSTEDDFEDTLLPRLRESARISRACTRSPPRSR